MGWGGMRGGFSRWFLRHDWVAECLEHGHVLLQLDQGLQSSGREAREHLFCMEVSFVSVL